MGCSCQTHYASGEVPQRGDVVSWNGFTRTVVSPVGCDSYWCEDGTVQHIPAARLVRREGSPRYASGEEPRVGDVADNGEQFFIVSDVILGRQWLGACTLVQRGPCSKCK